MINCHASSLALELKDVTDATIQNCTFGHWTFRQVQNIFIENITNIFNEGNFNINELLQLNSIDKKYDY